MTTAAAAPLLKHMQDWTLLTALALAPFVTLPAIVHAQQAEITPFPIADGLNVSRGQIIPSSAKTQAYSLQDTCTIARLAWGWSDCAAIDGYVVGTTPATDSVLIMKPDNEGYVRFDDWNDADVAELMRQVEADMAISAREQTANLGYPVSFNGWRVPPTLDQAKARMYYATEWQFGDDVSINVEVTQFDRRGFVNFSIVPFDNAITEAAMVSLIDANMALYTPTAQQDYASFTDGDKVAAVGALGLLGAFFGVKYSKSIGGLIAVALAFGKKFIGLIIVAILGVFGLLSRAFARDS